MTVYKLNQCTPSAPQLSRLRRSTSALQASMLYTPHYFFTPPSLHFLEICLVAATQAWNTVPLDVKAALSLAAFGQTQTVCFMRCFLVADRPN